MTHPNIDLKKVRYALFIGVVSFILTIFIKPLAEDNANAVNVIVTVFAILAGFLIALITLVGDTNHMPQGSWRVAFYHSDKITNVLIRYKWLFYLYLLILLLVFLSFLLPNKFSDLVNYIQYAYIFCSVLAFIISFRIPSYVIKMHQERIEEEIMRRRRIDGIK
jgi:hypothetical protein